MKDNILLKNIKTLISIPSFVDGNKNEKYLCSWIYNYLCTNSALNVSKQYIDRDRSNILATNSDNPKKVIVGHIDTVQTSKSWSIDPFKPVVSKKRIYGLGATDMKAGVAVMLSLATNPNLEKDVMFLFYCDEEYDFKGMRKFIKTYKNKINPDTLISLDGEGLEIGNSCRGLIELKVSVSGKKGHSALKNGVNAIEKTFVVISKLENYLKRYRSETLGESTLNIAYISGGSNKGIAYKNVILGNQGNIIADYCEYILEVRTSNLNLNADKVTAFVKNRSKKEGLKINEITRRHNLNPWITPKSDLKNYLEILGNENLKNPEKTGYLDIQMHWEAFGRPTAFSLGCGKNGMSHKSDEFVETKDVLALENYFKKIICK